MDKDPRKGELLTFKLSEDQIKNYMAPCWHPGDCAPSVINFLSITDGSVIDKLVEKSNGRGIHIHEIRDILNKVYNKEGLHKITYDVATLDRDLKNINSINSLINKNKITIAFGNRISDVGHAFIIGKNDKNKLFIFDTQNNSYYDNPTKYLTDQNISSISFIFKSKVAHDRELGVKLREKPLKDSSASKKQRIRTYKEQLEKEIKEEKEKVDKLVNEFEKMSIARGLQKRRKTTKKTMKKTKRRGNIKRKNTRRDSKKYK